MVTDCRDKSSTKDKNYSAQVKKQAAVVSVTFESRNDDVIKWAEAETSVINGNIAP